MLSAHHLNKNYGIHTVLQDITFNLNSSERTGLIGPNGCGKSTLLRILAGREKPDSGIVSLTPSNLRIGYLAQGLELDPGLTLEEYFAPLNGEFLEAELINLSSALTTNPVNQDLQQAYDKTLDLISADRVPLEVNLSQLNLGNIPFRTPISSLSGGQKTRLMLARLLQSDPSLLLLDEPTNHLDIAMLDWLESWLTNFKGTVLVVSHDRLFLDNTVTSILELDPTTHGIKRYAGNYSDYIEQKEASRVLQLQTYLDQQAEIGRLKADIQRTKEQATRTERAASSIRKGGPDYKVKGYKTYKQAIAKGTAKKAKAREKKLERFLDSEDLVERPRTTWQMKLEFAAPEHSSKDILLTDALSIGYEGHPALLNGLRLEIHSGQRVVLTGPNGCGKTTLLRTIAGNLPPLSGSIHLGASAKLGYMTQEQENLDLSKSPLQSILTSGRINQTEARAFLHYFLFTGDDSLRFASTLSFGERARLELAFLVSQGCTFLLLDEPINHLDIPARARFEQALARYSGTVLAVLHDRYFIRQFATQVWTVENGTIRIL